MAFLDDDDLWLPGKLEAELSVFERFPDAEAVVSDSLMFVEGQAAPRSFSRETVCSRSYSRTGALGTRMPVALDKQPERRGDVFDNPAPEAS